MTHNGTMTTSNIWRLVASTTTQTPTYVSYATAGVDASLAVCGQNYMLSGSSSDNNAADAAGFNDVYTNNDINSSSSRGTGDSAAADSLAGVHYFQALVYCMYLVIFVIALLGNGIVCYVVRSTPRMRTVTNILIVNLAVGDILMTVFCVPFSFVSILVLAYWPFGAAMCYLVNFSQAVSVLVSAYTLVAISVDRYMAIMWPLRPRITKRYARACVFVWVCVCVSCGLFGYVCVAQRKCLASEPERVRTIAVRSSIVRLDVRR